MKIEKPNHLKIERIGEEDDTTMEASIANDSLPFVFDIISRQLYSDPIGSIVREITSNCFDSHKEANVDDPVIIRKSYDRENEQWFIEFEDFGVGLSPERIESIYMNYFSSTKRGNNEQIGGFGLGSKTPLAYSDYFYILTRYEAVEYEYVFHKGETKPTIDLLSQSETLERNGTIIKIPIKIIEENIYHRNECYLFENKLKDQLLYFDDVYFEGWDINNTYTIYNGKYFKFRSDIDQNKRIHICMGKVTYPINFNQVKIDTPNFPIGVKFEIGELPVTPSREEIRYTDEVKNLIKERVNLAIEEVMTRYNDQNPEIDNIEEYISIRNERPKLVFDKKRKHQLFIHSDYVDTKHKFGPISRIGIKKTPKNLFFEWQTIGYISDGVYKDDRYDFYDTDLDNKCIILNNGEHVSKYGAIYAQQILGYNRIKVIKKKNLDYNNNIKILGLTGKSLGKAKKILEYSKIIDSIIKTRYSNYNEFKPTQQWIEEYKREIYTQSQAYLRKQNKKIFVRHYLNGRYNGDSDEISEYDLINRTGITIYGFRDDKEELQLVANFLRCKRTIKKGGMKAAIVIQVAQSSQKLFKDNKRARHCSEFFKTKIFKKIATAHKLYYDISYNNIIKYKDHIKYFNDLIPKVQLIKDFIKENKVETDSRVLTYGEKHNAFIPELIKMIDIINEGNNFELPKLITAIDYIDSEDIQEELIEYLKFKKIRLNNKFYLTKPITENGNIQQEESICEENREQEILSENQNNEDRIEHDNEFRIKEIFQESNDGGIRLDQEESRTIQQEWNRESEERHNQDVSTENGEREEGI